MAPEWYEHFFTPLAFAFWRAAVPAEVTAREARFLVQALAVAPPARLLDFPCGLGRHSLALSADGFRVTGLDLADAGWQEAARQASDRGLGVTFARSDMRQPVPGGPYDGAFCFGNSFGYLTDDENHMFARHVREAVAPGARWVIDTGAVTEALVPHLAPERSLEAGGVRYVVRSHHDAERRRLVQACVLDDGTRREVATLTQAVYPLKTLRGLLENEGWDILRLDGDLEGTPFAPGHRRVVVVAQRPKG